MQYVPITVEPVYQAPGIVGMLKKIELVGRVCYHTEDKITDDSYIKFVAHQVKDHHMSPLEHGSVYLIIPYSTATVELIDFFKQNTYSFVIMKDDEEKAYVSTNYRVIVENDLETFMKEFWSEQTEIHMPRFTIKSNLNIAGYKDQTRHRAISPLIESTRYCNYIREKFGSSIKFIHPSFFDIKPEDYEDWGMDCMQEEQIYMRWINKGYTPQQASEHLTQAVAATTYWSAFLPDWDWFLYLRYYEKTGKVRPEVKAESTMVYNLLIKEFPDYEW